MPSIKCSHCNLVNFSTQQHCKRCGNPLNDYAPLTDQRPSQTNFEQPYQTQQFQGNFEQNYQPRQYQTSFEQTYPTQPFNQPLASAPPFQNPAFQNLPAQFQTFQMPPPPNYYNDQFQPQQMMSLSCIKCGGGNGVSIQNFKKEYVPPFAYVALLIGLVPGAIIIALIRVTHRLNAPFCHECWSKFRKVGIVEALSALFFFVGVVAATVVGFALNSGIAFFVVFAMTIGVVVWGQIYKSKNSPKYKKISRHQVIVTDPLRGDVYLQS